MRKKDYSDTSKFAYIMGNGKRGLKGRVSICLKVKL